MLMDPATSLLLFLRKRAARRELLRAISRNEKRLREIAREWHVAEGVCCPSCWSEEYRYRSDKLERQEAWSKILHSKPL